MYMEAVLIKSNKKRVVPLLDRKMDNRCASRQTIISLKFSTTLLFFDDIANLSAKYIICYWFDCYFLTVLTVYIIFTNVFVSIELERLLSIKKSTDIMAYIVKSKHEKQGKFKYSKLYLILHPSTSITLKLW